MSLTKIPGTELTPRLMAQAFWDMSTDEQVLFFAELNQTVQHSYATDPISHAWSLGQLQWLYLGHELNKNKPAREMLMAMAAPMFLHALTAIEHAA